MKALVIFSGGLDSTICLAKAIEDFGKKNVTALSFDYGQKNYKELIKAEELTSEYKIKHIKMNICSLFETSNSSMLRHSDREIPKETYDEQVKKLKGNEDVSTNVPFRNGLMLSIAASIALSKKIDIIYYGIHLENGIARSLYPDCGEEFNNAINEAIYIGTGKKVKVIAPLVNMTKKEIVALGAKMKVPFEKTWTCYENDEHPCGKCTACMDRIAGFKENNLIDPLV